MKKVLLSLAVLCCSVGAWAGDAITAATYGNATGNTTRTMTIALTHGSTNYCAFQADLTLPEGTTVTAVTAKSPLVNNGKVTISDTEYSTDFNVPFYQAAGTTACRVIGYNYGNEVIGGTSGDVLLTLTLTTSSAVDYNATAVAVSNVIFVSKDGDDALASVSMANLAADDNATYKWGDIDHDDNVNANDINYAVSSASSGTNGKTEGLDLFATGTTSTVFNANDINAEVNFAK